LTSQQIEIFVNGDRFEVPSGRSITSVLEFLKIQPDRVAVELDKALVRKRDWDATRVGSGARIEVVEFVGGG
jgi:thiamine biosynthesis protein ThiS